MLVGRLKEFQAIFKEVPDRTLEAFSFTIGGWSEDRLQSELSKLDNPEAHLAFLKKLHDKATSNWGEFRTELTNKALKAQSEELGELKKRISKLLEDAGISKDSDMGWNARAALEEALNNHLMHGNRLDPRKRIEVEICFVRDNSSQAVEALLIRSQDEGQGFDSVAARANFERRHPLTPHGMGLGLMDKFSRLKYLDEGRGCLMIFTPELKSPGDNTA